VRLWCGPGAIFELGRLAVPVAPPERMAELLELPEIAQFHTRYLHHGLSGVLFRVPPVRSEHFEAAACATLDEPTAVIRSSSHTVLMAGRDPALAVGLEGEERGRRTGRLRAALKRRARSAIVIVFAPAMDAALRLVADGSDQAIWLVSEPAEARPNMAVAARAKGQRALF